MSHMRPMARFVDTKKENWIASLIDILNSNKLLDHGSVAIHDEWVIDQEDGIDALLGGLN